MNPLEQHADTITGTAILNCLGREASAVEGRVTVGDTHVTIGLPRTGTVLRARRGRWMSDPERRVGDRWRPLDWRELVTLVCRELTLHTGAAPEGFVAEIAQSRAALGAMLRARAEAPLPEEPYRRSEQALVAGHRYHPAPKGRGGAAAEQWLPYTPEAHTCFPLRLLAVRADAVAEEGTVTGLDGAAAAVPDGYRPLVAHPWQLDLLEERLRGLFEGGVLRWVEARHRPVWPTSSVRTVYDPAADAFLKFSLDVRITNDIRRMWRYDLRWTSPLAGLLGEVFAEVGAVFPGAAFLADRGYRTVDVGDTDVYEGLAVLLRDGVRAHARPGVTPLLAAGISEGFPGNPLDGLGADAALGWWRRYLAVVVPPALHAFFRHGVVLECHMQNVLVGVDGDGMPVQAFFRDQEGVRLLASRHAALLREIDGPHARERGVETASGWRRLQYCLVVNHLNEIAGAVVERHPALAADVWAEARAAFLAYGHDHGTARELHDLLTSPCVPGKTNMLLRWTRSHGSAATYIDHPNPLRLPAAVTGR
ncbi:IucA/IucC family protein [Actinomadura kijaniata]|uniref:IucA/IucC family protein n=1 Tax=Actinomadura kijaniata TaxID=46161 RepID=UPI0008327627|nr:IucA/IucC family protein [Actinomadura kijaniata]